MSPTIILASSSNIRAELLKNAHINFNVEAPNIDESITKQALTNQSPTNIAIKLACEKALAVCKRHSQPHPLVIGADQVCVFNQSILNKPLTHANTINQLTRLSGHTHQLISAIAIAQHDQILFKSTNTATLTMKPLTSSDIETYVNLDQPYHSCGGYYIEKNGHDLFESIDGDLDTIQGLPIKSLLNALNPLLAANK